MMLAGKCAVVTGGASGIGHAIVKRYVEEGARVVILDRNLELGGAVVDELNASKAGVVSFVEVDVRNSTSVAAAFAEVAATAGPTSILVTSAGIRSTSSPLDLKSEEWEREVGVNLSGTFYCAQAAARQMVKAGSGGSIITISSTAGLLAYENRPAYSASKFGVIGITKSLCRDLGPHGIRVNCICPGTMRTPFTEHYFTEEFIAHMPRVVPLGTYGVPEYISDGALFLASDLGRYVSGVVLPIDGGHSSIASLGVAKEASAAYSAPRGLAG